VSETELAWAAGLFDDEGHVRLDRGYIRVQIGQAHTTEVLYRFRDAVGMGTIYGPSTNKSGNRMWRYTVNGGKAITVLQKIWPYLCTPKRAQAKEALAAYGTTFTEQETRTA
jgi:hypothetical protein